MENKVVKVIIGILVVSVVIGTLFFLFKPIENGNDETIESSKNEEQLSFSVNSTSQESSETIDTHDHEELKNQIEPVEISNRSELIQNFLMAYLKRGGDYNYLESVKPYCVDSFYNYLEKYPERLPLDRQKQEVDSLSVYSVEDKEDVYFVDVYLKTTSLENKEETDYLGYYVSIEGGKVSGAKINESK